MPDARTLGYLPAFADQTFMNTIRTVAGIRLILLENQDSVARYAPQLDGLITGGGETSYSQVVADTLRSKALRLEWIQLTSAGHDALARFGVPDRVALTNNGGGFDKPVAEHAMALLLGLSHSLPAALDRTALPRWDRARAQPAFCLDGRCLAIIGLGGIGREVAHRARAFGMSVIGVTRSGRPDPAAHEVAPATKLHEVLSRADAVVLCAPLTPDTLHLLNAQSLAACRRGALVVNVGRGKLIDTDALMDALASGQIGGAALDVTDPEPLPDDHPLWMKQNVVITPHVAPAGCPLAVQSIAEHIRKNALRFAGNLPLDGRFTLS
ncbi:D-2-hydroxyacid dehydrogenase [Roseinatronobacter alkalisoli]|uniref:D-2-hydroxyacid dehydrogenase n=1 Tax=Roseinatronobacter alkalisoli TaxID=3028235 RepID=A0ABT5TD73_9RHOB|nr:D-2-hydroxyacid dehydrogenase [Roseinatronobacter sp. HJB301]MDD7973080.1 D-2-hydroxyacid dehydrogenase [Roseinatronobacter sp. HJB301]